MKLDIYNARRLRDRTYRHTPGANGIDVTLRFTSTTSVRMVAYILVSEMRV